MVDRLKELQFLTNVIKACTKLNDMVIERTEEIKREVKEFEDSMNYTKQIFTEEEIDKEYNKQMGVNKS
jgi:hypothetical protein|tara:strand:- start:357 stop:563 length:207 start_codon:yes stop_codon:yes gene_type:complete